MTDGIFTAAAALLTAAGSIYVAYNNRKKAQAQERDATRVAYLSLVDPLEKRIDRLESRVIKLESDNIKLRNGIRILSSQLMQLGHEPAWRYEDEEGE